MEVRSLLFDQKKNHLAQMHFCTQIFEKILP